ncbi:hypothetical protein ZIOFF_018909 [Zingiber officinale]|uniref:phosphoenolpyruvate carboxykinase (ATP) n=1 Tax=Zingiber officinale TaxID=94328 RepID=A0A8J5HH32_ZINOF|nr:hypothetical protein ZIOFF_018909 [Zingiber officinale]
MPSPLQTIRHSHSRKHTRAWHLSRAHNPIVPPRVSKAHSLAMPKAWLCLNVSPKPRLKNPPATEEPKKNKKIIVEDEIDVKYKSFKKFDTVKEHSDHYFSIPEHLDGVPSCREIKDRRCIRTTPEELEDFSTPDFTIYNAGQFPCNRYTHYMTTSTSIDLNLDRKEMVILGTQYAGEMKKGLFGTGKTTLSTDHNRLLIGDDEDYWSENGISNIEGGCYAKCIGLTKEKEPDIWNAIKFGTGKEVDYSNNSITENTRASYPIEYIPNAKIPCVGPHPKNVILLSCDAFGVLPPVSKLTLPQTMYHFINGYTALLLVAWLLARTVRDMVERDLPWQMLLVRDILKVCELMLSSGVLLLPQPHFGWLEPPEGRVKSKYLAYIPVQNRDDSTDLACAISLLVLFIIFAIMLDLRILNKFEAK